LAKGLGEVRGEGEQGKIGGDSFGHPSRYFDDLGAETEWSLPKNVQRKIS
jgi:hypothetical protein